MELYKDGILIAISVRFWTAMKTLSPNDFGLRPMNLPCFGKKELLPRRIIHKFRAIESKARFSIENSSLNFPIGNTRFIPIKRFKKVVQTLKKYKKEYKTLVEELIANYNDLRKEVYPLHKNIATTIYTEYKPSIQLSKDVFIDEYFSQLNTLYPDKKTLREKFSLTWTVYEISFPKTRTINYNEY